MKDNHAVAFIFGARVEVTSRYIRCWLIDNEKDPSKLIVQILHGNHFKV